MQPKKPQGVKGPLGISPAGMTIHPVEFPTAKPERELLIANIFVNGSRRLASDPLVPFSDPKLNPECDLDISITVANGQRRKLELVEYAPLDLFGGKYANVPSNHLTGDVAKSIVKLIKKKSAHYAGNSNLLLIYTTENAFSVPSPALELIRRMLSGQKLAFERIYFLSPHSTTEGSTSLVYPREPHDWYARWDSMYLASRVLRGINVRDIQRSDENREGITFSLD